MPKRSRKQKLPDPNEFAAGVLGEIIARTDPSADPPPVQPPDASGKNPAAVALGRLGGLKGGPARAKKLGKKKLSEAARKAARARWQKEQG